MLKIDKHLWDYLRIGLGWADYLLPIVQPGVSISPGSKLKKLGQVPSEINSRGFARGIPEWDSLVPSNTQLDDWAGNVHYGIGLRADYIRGLDIDVPDVMLANEIRDWALERTGAISYRFRDMPGLGKCLIPLCCDCELNKKDTKVEGGIIELLADGNQFVLYGAREDGSSYVWNTGVPKSIPVLTKPELLQLWVDLVSEFGIGKPKDFKPKEYSKGIHNLQDDVVVEALKESGLILHENDGMIYIECPWKSEHTSDSGYSETVYYQAGHNGYENGFKCLHAHCSSKNRYSLMMYLGIHEKDMPVAEKAVEEDRADIIVVSETNKVNSVENAGFKIGTDGFATDNFLNACKWLENQKGFFLRYDSFKDSILISEKKEKTRQITDNDYLSIRRMMLSCGTFRDISKANVVDAIKLKSRDNTYDSGIEWIHTLAWDGTPRIHNFFSGYFGTNNTQYAQVLGEYIWSSLAARILYPGYKVDCVPILCSTQGAGKTSALQAMVPDDSMYTGINMSDSEDEISRKLRGVVVAEWGEAKGIKTRDSQQIKDWITKRKDVWRPLYCEHTTDMYRRFVVIATVNKGKILNDPTGERRYAPIKVSDKISVAKIERDRDQLWAEGVAYLALQGQIPWFKLEELAEESGLRNDFKRIDPWEVKITGFLSLNPDATNEQLLEAAIQKETKDSTLADLDRVESIRIKLGV